jgi:hypothetical protein
MLIRVRKATSTQILKNISVLHHHQQIYKPCDPPLFSHVTVRRTESSKCSNIEVVPLMRCQIVLLLLYRSTTGTRMWKWSTPLTWRRPRAKTSATNMTLDIMTLRPTKSTGHYFDVGDPLGWKSVVNPDDWTAKSLGGRIGSKVRVCLSTADAKIRRLHKSTPYFQYIPLWL